MTIGFFNKRVLALEKNQFDERKLDRLVQNFGLQRPQSGRASFSPPYSRRRQKGALPARGFLNKRVGVFRTSPVTHPVFLLTFTLRAK